MQPRSNLLFSRLTSTNFIRTHLVRTALISACVLSTVSCSQLPNNSHSQQSAQKATQKKAQKKHISNAKLIQQRQAQDPLTWKKYVGKSGPSGWRVNVIQPDPLDHGPDGFNHHDWDGDGDLDIFVNFEEGGYSRLYFNPGKQKIRDLWTDYIQLPGHGQCEDSGIGDLDNDGDIDYIANGGHIFFNPGQEKVRSVAAWQQMTLFRHEARNPVVTDVDGDGLQDLVVAATTWYKQPVNGKHLAKNWQKFEIGQAKWPMTTLVTDIDGDGDNDLLIQERRKQGTFYFDNPGQTKVQAPWPVKSIDSSLGGMFLAYGDVNNDGLTDIVKAGRKHIHIYLRTNSHLDQPNYQRVDVAIPKQPASVTVKPKPKGVAILELDGDNRFPEIVIIPEYEAQLWYLTLANPAAVSVDPKSAKWHNTLMDLPQPNSRKKMDNAFLVDLDGDGDLDIATTEENGGWGVIWFENPSNN